MSMFEKFLEKSKNIKIEHFMNSEDKNAHYFINSLKKNIKSLALLTILIPIGVQASSNNLSLPNQSEIQKIISTYAKDNNLPLENTQIIYKDSKEGIHSLHEMGNIKTCKIIMSTTGGGDFARLMNSGYDLNKKLYNEMVINHEISHCIDNKKFIGSGLSYSSEKWMSDWVVGEYVQSNPLKNIFEENFADSLAALTLLKNNNFSNSTVEFLKQWEKVRFNINENSEQNGSYFEDHNTSSSISYILSHIEDLKYVSKDDFIKIANNLASQSVMNAINNNRKVEKDFVIDDNGNIKTGGKKSLGNEGIKLLNNVMAGSLKTIRDISINIIYEYQKNGDIKNRDSEAFKIARDGFYFFNEQDWKTQTIESSIDNLDYQLSHGSYYKKMIDKNKSENNYVEFKKEVLKLSTMKIRNKNIEYVFQDKYKEVAPVKENDKKPGKFLMW